jgi:hypothetical protein
MDRFTGQTGVLPYKNRLVRQKWLREGITPIMEQSFWAAYIGNSKDAAVYQAADFSAGDGHNVIFDFDGFLSNEGRRGKEQAYGYGETKKKFSSSITIERGRYVVHNGDEFDLENIDAIDLAQHQDSARKLGELWAKNKNQYIFDVAQGFAEGKEPTHIWRPNKRSTMADLTPSDVLTVDVLTEIELSCRTGQGFAVGRDRMPLIPVSGNYGGRYTMIIDAYQEAQLRKDAEWKDIMKHADVRGQKNRLIQGYIGSIGLLDIVTAPSFYGSSSSNKQYKTSVIASGMRVLNSAGKFQGTKEFTLEGEKQIGRAIVLGQSAIQLASGKSPDFKLQESEDFGIDSESAIIVYSKGQKTQLRAETEDYDGQAALTGIDFGMFVVDTYVAG